MTAVEEMEASSMTAIPTSAGARRFLALAATLPLFAAAGAVRAETVFVGDTQVLAVTTNCSGNISVGETARFTYRPAGPGLGNGADSYLAYVGSRSSYTMTTPNNTFRAGINYAAQGLGSRLTLTNTTAGITGWTQNPATITTTTTSAELVSTFANFWGVKGCTATIRSNLLKMN
ncbi:MAG: hypothetical protein DI565_18645 [Ancylobacter novellus]|uniref:Uncharacterized protein n=1 Tax=Ancylobacter novellus TaxID=921 RepID=A0A2W5K3C9_ANCNO|nr:MAG: hypothetical protein DI565_18645 [Ancylobacter novellus]